MIRPRPAKGIRGPCGDPHGGGLGQFTIKGKEGSGYARWSSVRPPPNPTAASVTGGVGWRPVRSNGCRSRAQTPRRWNGRSPGQGLSVLPELYFSVEGCWCMPRARMSQLDQPGPVIPSAKAVQSYAHLGVLLQYTSCRTLEGTAASACKWRRNGYDGRALTHH